MTTMVHSQHPVTAEAEQERTPHVVRGEDAQGGGHDVSTDEEPIEHVHDELILAVQRRDADHEEPGPDCERYLLADLL